MSGSIGIIFSQLGSPANTSVPELRRYLRQFLGDPRVIEMRPLSRWLLLNLVILPRRPASSAELYRRIWTEKGAPLLLTTRAQAALLQAGMRPSVRVAVGMSYGDPSLASAVDELCGAGVDRLLLFSPYPQYSSPTTGSTCEAVFRLLAARRFIPALRVVPPYYRHPAYIEAVAAVAREHLAGLGFKPDKVLFSFHGIPRKYADRGDPYPGQAEESARLIAAALGFAPGEWMLSFQSRFGRDEWLKPYTDETLVRLGREGLRRIAVICPGFTADCLETLDEIGNVGLEQFRSGGGEELSLIPCLNDHPAWGEGMVRIAREELSGWL
jgi:protoporphyrin/coproporphyrin ferrochelatase